MFTEKRENKRMHLFEYMADQLSDISWTKNIFKRSPSPLKVIGKGTSFLEPAGSWRGESSASTKAEPAGPNHTLSGKSHCSSGFSQLHLVCETMQCDELSTLVITTYIHNASNHLLGLL